MIITTCRDIEESRSKKYWQLVKTVTRYKSKQAHIYLEMGGHGTSNDEEASYISTDHLRKTYEFDRNSKFKTDKYEEINNKKVLCRK